MSIFAEQFPTAAMTRETARIFLRGDVMTGRGIDQILPHPCAPLLHENYVKSARDYVRLAEQVSGRIPRAVKFSYNWGAALQELTREQPDARIINLETSITRRGAFVPKGINYRMGPENAVCLVSADVDCWVLANNHILDWAILGFSTRWKVWSVRGSSRQEPGLTSIKRAPRPPWIFPVAAAFWCFRWRW